MRIMLEYVIYRCRWGFPHKQQHQYNCRVHVSFLECFFRRYLTKEFIWLKSIFHKALKGGTLYYSFLLFAFLFMFFFFWEIARVSLSMLSAKQGNQWYFNVSVWCGPFSGIEPQPPALDVSTLSLGFRG